MDELIVIWHLVGDNWCNSTCHDSDRIAVKKEIVKTAVTAELEV